MENIETSEKLPRQEQRDELYQKVEQKVNYILEARKFAEESAGLTLAELKEKISLKLEAINGWLGPEVIARLENRCDRQAELDALGTASGKLSRKRYERAVELQDELSQMYKDNDVNFLEKIQRFYFALRTKKGRVDIEKEWWASGADSSFIKIFLNKHNLTANQVKVEYSGFSVNLILQPDDFERIEREQGVRGRHFHSTPFNLIKDSPVKDKTIRHEENHNLIEGFLGNREIMYVGQFINLLNAEIARYKKLKGEGAHEITLTYLRERLGAFINQYVEQNYEEILADLDSLAEGQISTYAANFFSAVDQIELLVDHEEDLEVKEIIAGQAEKMNEKFLRYLSRLASIFFAAEKIGKVDQAQALTILFRPEEIDKAERQLRQATPDFEAFQGLKPLLSRGSYFSNLEQCYKKSWVGRFRGMGLSRETSLSLSRSGPADELMVKLIEEDQPGGFFNPLNIERLHKIFQSGQAAPKLSEEDRATLEKAVTHLFEDWSLSDQIPDIFPQYQTVEKVLELNQRLQDLAAWLAVPQLKDFVSERLAHAIIENIFSTSIQSDDFSLLEEFINKWTLDKKALLERFLDLIIGCGLIFDNYQDYHRLTYNKTTIKQSNFWRFLKKMNLTEEAEKYL